MDQEPDAAVAAAVGRRIRELRRAAGLSLSELARRAGLGKGTLSELESGRRNPTLGTLYALTAPLGVGLAALIDLAGDYQLLPAAPRNFDGDLRAFLGSYARQKEKVILLLLLEGK